MLQALTYLWPGLRSTNQTSSAAPPADMTSVPRSADERPGRLPTVTVRPNLRRLRQQEVRNGARSEQLYSQYRNGSESRTREPTMEEYIRNKSRRMIAIELYRAKAAYRDLDATTQRLHSFRTSAIAENKELFVKNKQLQDRYQALESNYKDLQAKYATVNHNYKSLELGERKLQAKQQETERKYDFESSRYEFIQSNYFNVYGVSKNQKYDHATQASIERFLGPLLKDALDAAPLRTQVQASAEQLKSLQRQLLSNVEKVQSVTDEQFALDFRALASSIKSLSRSINLPGMVDIMDIDVIKQSSLVASVYQGFWAKESRQKCMIEAFIWSILYEQVFRSPLQVFGECLPGLSDHYFGIFGQDHQHLWPTPSALAERWRYTTSERLVEMVGSEAVTLGSMKNTCPVLERSVQNIRTEVAILIASPLAHLTPNLDFSQATNIVDEAFSLALQMSLQRSRIQVVYPKIGDSFVIGQPDLTTTYESEDAETGNVAAIVNPGLAKWGDSQGKNLDQRLDIIPSLVFVEPAAKAALVRADDSIMDLELDSKIDPESEQQIKIKSEYD